MTRSRIEKKKNQNRNPNPKKSDSGRRIFTSSGRRRSRRAGQKPRAATRRHAHRAAKPPRAAARLGPSRIGCAGSSTVVGPLDGGALPLG